MNISDSTTDPTVPRTHDVPRQAPMVFAVLGVLIGVGLIIFYQSVVAPARAKNVRQEANVAVAEAAEKNLEAARDATWKWAKERLQRHTEIVDGARQKLESNLAAYLGGRKAKVGDFVEDVTTWRSKWKALTDTEEHKKNVGESFKKYVLGDQELADAIKKCVDEFNATVAADDRSLVEELRTEMMRSTALSAEPFTQPGLYDQILAKAIADAEQRIQTRAFGETTGIALGFATTVAVSFANLQFVIGPMSIYAERVVGWIVERFIAVVTDLFGGSDKDIRDATNRALDEIANELLHGRDEAKLDFEALSRVAENDAVTENRTRATNLMMKMRKDGHLGILHAIQLLNQRADDVRAQALKNMIWNQVP